MAWIEIIAWIFVIACACGLVVVLLPVGKGRHLAVPGPQSRVDERDAVFHRFYRLTPGSPDFEAYYRDHPEKAEFDEALRTLPQLDQPGAKTFHPLASRYMSAIGAVIPSLPVGDETAPVADERSEASPEEITARVKGFARYLGADLVGCTELNPAYVYSRIGRGPGEWGAPIHLDNSHAIVVAVRMKHDMIRHAPDSASTTESMRTYLESARIASVLAQYIRLIGYRARAHVDGNYRVMCVPIAVDAGLGELGRLGLLITPEFGPRVRLSVVTTDMPLVSDDPITFGVQHFCTICKKCSANCPSASIDVGEKELHNGAEKWQSQQDSCYQYWRKAGSDCGVCIRVCPYSHPETWPHNVVRSAIRRNSLARRLALIGDDWLYGRRPKAATALPNWHRR